MNSAGSLLMSSWVRLRMTFPNWDITPEEPRAVPDSRRCPELRYGSIFASLPTLDIVRKPNEDRLALHQKKGPNRCSQRLSVHFWS